MNISVVYGESQLFANDIFASETEKPRPRIPTKGLGNRKISMHKLKRKVFQRQKYITGFLDTSTFTNADGSLSEKRIPGVSGMFQATTNAFDLFMNRWFSDAEVKAKQLVFNAFRLNIVSRGYYDDAPMGTSGSSEPGKSSEPSSAADTIAPSENMLFFYRDFLSRLKYEEGLDLLYTEADPDNKLDEMEAKVVVVQAHLMSMSARRSQDMKQRKQGVDAVFQMLNSGVESQSIPNYTFHMNQRPIIDAYFSDQAQTSRPDEGLPQYAFEYIERTGDQRAQELYLMLKQEIAQSIDGSDQIEVTGTVEETYQLRFMQMMTATSVEEYKFLVEIKICGINLGWCNVE